MKTLYLNLLFYTACCLLLFSSCEIKDNTPCAAQYTYHHLTAEEKSKTPYFNNPNFDTISFASSTGDTLTFALQRIDSSWYIEDMNRNPNPDGCPDWHYYETMTVNYISLNSSDKILTVLSKKGDIRQQPHLKFMYNGYTFRYNISTIGDNTYIRYVGDLIVGNVKHNGVYYEHSNGDLTKPIRGYVNESSGVILIDDAITSKSYSLVVK